MRLIVLIGLAAISALGFPYNLPIVVWAAWLVGRSNPA